MITPKFAYNAGAGIVDFTPTWPPTGKTPFAPLEAVRHDSITSSGIKQSVLERVDTFVILTFQHVPEDEMDNWAAFFAWVLQGNSFTYYPDSTVPATYTEYLLEDEAWAPKRMAFQSYSFTMKMRQAVGVSEAFS